MSKYVKFTYEDLDYGTSDSVIMIVPDGTDLDLFQEKLREFFDLYTSGDDFADYLNADKDGLDEDMTDDFAKDFPDISVGDAIFFANERDNGLSSELVASSFMRKYPEFNAEILSFDLDMTLNEYGD